MSSRESLYIIFEKRERESKELKALRKVQQTVDDWVEDGGIIKQCGERETAYVAKKTLREYVVATFQQLEVM